MKYFNWICAVFCMACVIAFWAMVSFPPQANVPRAIASLFAPAGPTLFVDGFDGSPDACPAGRQFNANICYNYNLANSACKTYDNVAFADLFQRNGPGKPITDFAGYQQFAVVKNLDKTKYLALRLDVPADGLVPILSGIITHGETYPGPLLDVAISARCGDFNPAATLCKSFGTNGGAIAGKWKLPTAVQTNGCPLVPGRSYYLNVKATHPAVPVDGCGGNLCPTTLQSNHTP